MIRLELSGELLPCQQSARQPKMAALQVRVLLTLTLTLALTTEMAAFQVATTTLENKAGQKVAASEALKGKVVALYVRLALSRTTPPATP